MHAAQGRRSRTIFLCSALLLHAACARPSASRPPHADAQTIAGWVRGEARRPVPVDARGASLGLQKLALDQPRPEHAEPEPGSCGQDLRWLLPVPGQPGVVLLSNAQGQLLRYADGEQVVLMATVDVPPVGELLGIVDQASPLAVVVRGFTGDTLWTLEISDTAVLTATPRPNGLPFGDRESFLQHHRVGRCATGTLGCLTLVADDTRLSIDRRAHPTAEPEIVMDLGPRDELYVADVAYADADGSSVYLLTAAVCEDDPGQSERGSGAVQPQGPP